MCMCMRDNPLSRPHLDGGVDYAPLQPEDQFGSPDSDELDSFSRDFNTAVEASLGTALSDNISVQISSPVGILTWDT